MLAAGARVVVGRHPSGMVLNRAGDKLFVTSSSTDRIAVVDTRSRRVVKLLGDPAPAGPSEGSTPNALALSPDERRLFVAEGDNSAVAVFDLESSQSGSTNGTATALSGRIPVLWYPTALTIAGESLLVVSGKGRGTAPNPSGPHNGAGKDPRAYTLGQLNGALNLVPLALSNSDLAQLSERTARANGWDSERRRKGYPPFTHVMLIIKENRTYDQVLGDLPEGDGDTALVFFPRPVSPNHHALAERFGLYDRFFTNAEVSAQGHPWSTSAYVTEYTEKTVHSLYADRRPDVNEGEVDEPATGYVWTAAVKKGLDVRVYGEYAEPDSATGKYRPSKPSLAGHVNPDYPSFDMAISDQRRADAWLAEFAGYVRTGRMPALEILHLPGDHTAGSRPGLCTPRACMADNDLALGRIVEAVSRSPFWPNTVVFVVEDDAQSGPDHVDSHRSVLLVLSAYSRPGTVHRFVNTTDVLATVEDILGLPSLSQFDYYGRPLVSTWAARPDSRPYAALSPKQDLGERNSPKAVGARESLTLDLASADRIDDRQFNHLLWSVIKGGAPFPTAARGSTLDFERDR